MIRGKKQYLNCFQCSDIILYIFRNAMCTVTLIAKGILSIIFDKHITFYKNVSGAIYLISLTNCDRCFKPYIRIEAIVRHKLQQSRNYSLLYHRTLLSVTANH